MTFFDIVDGEVSGSGDEGVRAELQSEVEALDALSVAIGRSLRASKAERIAIVYEHGGLGIRYYKADENGRARGLELKGEQSCESIVKKLL
ncbi:MAG: hypothetical protein P1V20_09635 [Verrucomicrobiales bacterium]|nr:hypothetical protein [Verrucomicrobiales bacterium]